MKTRGALVALWVPVILSLALSASTLHVPEGFATIQEAIYAANDGDIILVAPGIYYENLYLAHVSITLASQYLESEDESDILGTVIDGQGETVIEIDSVNPETTILGFTIQNGNDGISAHGNFRLLHNRIVGNEDGIDYESGGGECRWNVFENNTDDGIDLDGACEVTIEDCLVLNNEDDGIEIRLHPYQKDMLNIVIRRNVIQGNGEDGIQFIDYSTRSNRTFLIERNVIVDSAMAGVGCMGNKDTRENCEAYDIPERIVLLNNTFSGNTYGVTGGDNMLIVNNIFLQTAQIALKGVDGESVTAFNLFWSNGTDAQDTNWLEETCHFADPMLDTNWHPLTGSPCIDSGVPNPTYDARDLVDRFVIEYVGAAPDLGAFEAGVADEEM